MLLVLLSGNSAKTKEWIEEVEHELRDIFESTYIQYYDHWNSGEKFIDLEHELEKLSSFLSDKENYMVFAKSAGVLLALKGIYEDKISPQKCIFAGTPINSVSNFNISPQKLFQGPNIPCYFVQKSQDPAIGSKELDSFLKKNKVENYKLFEIEGNDHHYGDMEELKTIVKELKDNSKKP